MLKEGGFQSNYFTIRVDGGEAKTIRLENGRERYAMATGLTPGMHTVIVSKRTEHGCGMVTLLGVEISAGGELLAPPSRSNRRIEFIGDSITCGYGNEAPDEKHHFAPATENNDLAYGAITARRFGAEYVCIAWSGIGIYRDYGGRTENNMSLKYEKILASDSTAIWDFRAPPPQVVVINLGTNDFAKGDPGANYIDAYKALIKTVRGHYPDASIFCALGAMIDGEKAVKNKQYIDQVISDLKDPRLYFVSLGAQDGKRNGFGADWHPSLKTHAAMAESLVAAVEAKSNWKQLH